MRKKVESVRASYTMQDRIEQEIVLREREILAKDFRLFVEAAWHIVEPGVKFLPGYHIDAVCEHLQACSDRDITRLVITIPPRHTKSTLCSVLYPAWLWTHSPYEAILGASYSAALSIRDAVKSRRVIESDWFKARWPHVVLLDDANAKSAYQNNLMGVRQTTSVGGTVTGLGGTHLLLDDPHNVKDAESAAIREAAVEWFRESWATRANTSDTVRLVIQQRVHQRDVAGYCIDAGGWVHLNLPMQFEGKKAPPTPKGWQDPREEFGATLWPARYSVEDALALKAELGEYAYAGQFQQQPTPRGGGMFKREWFRFWYDPELGTPAPMEIQDEAGEWVTLQQKPLPPVSLQEAAQSWDLSFKGGPKADFVVGQVWAVAEKNRGERFLLDQERGRWDFPATLSAMRRLSVRFPTYTKWVEEKANGSAVIATLANEIPGIIPVQPQGGKESRAAAVAGLVESGSVYLPHPDQFPWVKDLLEELATFPRGVNDDQVDAMTQALMKMQHRKADIIDLFGPGGDSGDGGFLADLLKEGMFLE